tara:strand:+ start:1746 stop:2378 length:633 start_codon:yes stop_codon:yes gene_type:complete
MGRTSDSSVISKLSKKAITYYDCVELTTIQNSVVRTYKNTNAPFDITIDVNGTNTFYKATGQFLAISNIEENTQFEIDKININMNALDINDGYGNPLLATFMSDTTVYIDQPVNIRRVFLNDNNTVDNWFEIFDGTISDLQISTSNSDAGRSLVVVASSHWADFTRINTNRTNTSSQNARSFLKNLAPSAQDKGFDYAVETQKDLEWKAE